MSRPIYINIGLLMSKLHNAELSQWRNKANFNEINQLLMKMRPRLILKVTKWQQCRNETSSVYFSCQRNHLISPFATTIRPRDDLRSGNRKMAAFAVRRTKLATVVAHTTTDCYAIVGGTYFLWAVERHRWRQTLDSAGEEWRKMAEKLLPYRRTASTVRKGGVAGG